MRRVITGGGRFGHLVVAIVATTVVAVACGSATPPPTAGPAASPGGSSGSVVSPSPAALEPAVPAWADPANLPLTPEAAAAAEEAMAAQVLEESGITAALGPETSAWLAAFVRDSINKGHDEITDLAGTRRVASSVPLPMTAAADIGGLSLALAGPLAATLVEQGGTGEPVDREQPLLDERDVTETDGQRTETRVTATARVRASGSSLQVDITIRMTGQVFDAASGARQEEFEVISTGTVELDFCPDSGGYVAGRSSMTMTASGTGGAGLSTSSRIVDTEIRATVNDAAWLASYRVDGEAESGSGGRSARARATLEYGVSGGNLGTMTATRAGGEVISQQPGTTDAELSELYQAIGQVAAMGSTLALSKAQDKWRDGACVRIDTGGEQGGSVDPDARVTITARPVHVFEQTDLDKPVEGGLTGEGNLEPANTSQDPPASLQYTAPSEEGKSGTVTLTSTSNRGIGTATLIYKTEAGAWSIDVNGTFSASMGSLKITGKVTGHVDRATLESGGWGTAKVTTTFDLQVCRMTSKATESDLRVELAEQGEEAIAITFDIPDETVGRIEGQCMGGPQMAEALTGGGGYSQFWLEPLGPVVVSKAGGTVSVSGSKPFAAGLTAKGKATVTVTRIGE